MTQLKAKIFMTLERKRVDSERASERKTVGQRDRSSASAPINFPQGASRSPYN